MIPVIEVEYRVNKKLEEEICRLYGVDPESLPIVGIKDTYKYFSRATKASARYRKANQNGKEKFLYEEKFPSLLTEGHLHEYKEHLTEEQYLSRLSEFTPIVVVEGCRKGIWVKDGKIVEKSKDSLHLCFDYANSLGNWTEFEVEVSIDENMSLAEIRKKSEEAKRSILEFAREFGIVEFESKHYAEMIMELEQQREIQLQY